MVHIYLGIYMYVCECFALHGVVGVPGLEREEICVMDMDMN